MERKRLRVVTSINGRIVPLDRARISVFDNSLLYAEGLFETLLAIDDRPLFFDQHFDRLHRGAAATGLRIPVSRHQLSTWMRTALATHPARIKKLRLTVTAGESARWVGIKGSSQVIISVSPHVLPTRPFKLFVSPLRVDQRSSFRRIKTLSYAIHAASLRQAKAHLCDDALLLNEAGQVAEVTSANIFWVIRNRVYTPPLAAGCLEGVTRLIVLDESYKLGISVEERQITLRSLLHAEELFISSSLKLVVPVSRILTPERAVQFSSGPVTNTLARYFRHRIGLRS
ncbi:MAG TPA: aminotransferase class IV [Candidatus Acidoferrum sp.]|nr:aminotransferase class IV [Candidatus Acidoferrum sp.]